MAKSCWKIKQTALEGTPKFQLESLTAEARPFDDFDPHQKHG